MNGEWFAPGTQDLVGSVQTSAGGDGMRLSVGDAEHIAEVVSGLATPARVLILARLLDSPATVSELVAELGMSQTSISNHLRILRHLNLAVGDRQGRNVLYRLQDDHVRAMIEQILSHASHD